LKEGLNRFGGALDVFWNVEKNVGAVIEHLFEYRQALNELEAPEASTDASTDASAEAGTETGTEAGTETGTEAGTALIGSKNDEDEGPPTGEEGEGEEESREGEAKVLIPILKQFPRMVISFFEFAKEGFKFGNRVNKYIDAVSNFAVEHGAPSFDDFLTEKGVLPLPSDWTFTGNTELDNWFFSNLDSEEKKMSEEVTGLEGDETEEPENLEEVIAEEPASESGTAFLKK
jgi:hypothetical protein